MKPAFQKNIIKPTKHLKKLNFDVAGHTTSNCAIKTKKYYIIFDLEDSHVSIVIKFRLYKMDYIDFFKFSPLSRNEYTQICLHSYEMIKLILVFNLLEF